MRIYEAAYPVCVNGLRPDLRRPLLEDDSYSMRIREM